ncbi:hypothetical protein BKA67DRAFT_583660 [Truncatella angustata]|uniref:Uncharacterized protein n=1 Tax=Truncatella angustata TaxID=152316 RepID=A0A9P8UC44_9PEZI|nr:uncharacterized protein BKA67DRAFT_583660 [Truncatella angustata]KAH6646251.1 hypothetical protein BKA67DRAFT_583660 [Truncatella angustata]
MHFSTVLSTLACGSVVFAQLPQLPSTPFPTGIIPTPTILPVPVPSLPAGFSALAADILAFIRTLLSTPGDSAVAVDAIRKAIAALTRDVAALQGGISGVPSLPDGGQAFVDQIASTICPQIKSIEAQLPSLPFPSSLFVPLFNVILALIIGQSLTTALGSIPSTASIDKSVALVCLSEIIPNLITRSGGATLPIDFTA